MSRKIKNIKINQQIVDQLSKDESVKGLRPAELFAQRLRMSQENRDVKLAMGQKRRQRIDDQEKRQIYREAHCKRFKYYK